MKTATIDWKPFSDKHKRYINTALDSKMSVAEGAIRSGKTIDNCIIASMYLETCKDKIHLASGSSAGNAKLNIGTCNGYGLEYLFRGRCRWGSYRDNSCLYINTKTGEKIVIFAGGGLANSYKKILGNSYGLWIATEINQHYDSDDSETSFIKNAFGRQAASEQPKILWDLNPSNPHHKIYTDYIDRYKTEYVGGYNYQHFTIADNLTVTEQRRREIEVQYNKDSVWYKRDILGERCTAEGLVYQSFADNVGRYIVSLEEISGKIVCANIGVDFGGTKSATTFVCTGFTQGFRDVVPLMSERHTEKLDPEKLGEAFSLFVLKCYTVLNKPFNVYADSAETVLINGLKRTALANALPVVINNAKKKPISERITLINKLIAQDRFKICRGAQSVIDAMCEVIFDPKKYDDERLDNGTTDVDTCDALEYSIEPFMAQLSII